MKKKDLGTKHVCYQCGCRFYDFKKPQPVCPKCGVNQNEAPHRSLSGSTRSSPGLPQRGKMRKRKEDDWEAADDGFILDEEVKTPSLEDGLTLIEDDLFSEAEEEDASELE